MRTLFFLFLTGVLVALWCGVYFVSLWLFSLFISTPTAMASSAVMATAFIMWVIGYFYARFS